MTQATPKRCAVYTRKSSEEGLEQEFNSLQAQREACEAFIASQRSEGWRLVPKAYDDGGISGGTMERPALQALLADITVGKVDVIVVYKVDRLTRSLADFAKMVEVFDAKGVSFVAVTQQFNTTTSMGRLTLNVLLSFAQFEREVTGERIRDKIAASKSKGIWMGGYVPLGYEARDRKLLVVPEEAELVREVFRRYLELKNVRLLLKELMSRGLRRRSGKKNGGTFSKGGLYKLLGNPVYVGEIPHKGKNHAGQHQAIVERPLWDEVQATLTDQAVRARSKPWRKNPPSPLMGKLFEESGRMLTPQHTSKRGRRYRYYHSSDDGSGGAPLVRRWRLPAPEIEHTVSIAALPLLKDRTALAAACQAAELDTQVLPGAVIEAENIAAALEADSLRAEALTNAVDRIDLQPEGFRLGLRIQLREGTLKLQGFVPMRMRKRGQEVKLVIAATPNTHMRCDPVLLKALGRAQLWKDDLIAGKSTSQIAKEHGITQSYVSRVLRLAFLAPSIIESILKGTQPPDLTTNRLLLDTALDPDWSAQRRQLGFT
jgi:site-specific DNA recombinase